MTHPHPSEIAVQDWSAYAMMIDARSPREFALDHIPQATNLPVVDNEQYAEVGTLHRSDPHMAYNIGVRFSLTNIAQHLASFGQNYTKTDRFLVYCARGGKRSKLWTDALRTIGFTVDVLPGGYKSYRRWVLASLESLPKMFDYRVLTGSTGCGKTRLLSVLAELGQQVIDLEQIAQHRGSLIGAIPGVGQPTQKQFDSQLLEYMRRLDPERPVWVEAESRKIGNIALPPSLYDGMSGGVSIEVVSDMQARVKLWREDYRHFVTAPMEMVEQLKPLRPLVGGEEIDKWQTLAMSGAIDELFARVMTMHYDPCYRRSSRRLREAGATLNLSSLDNESLAEAVRASGILN